MPKIVSDQSAPLKYASNNLGKNYLHIFEVAPLQIW